MATKKGEVGLGFVEETDSWRLLSHFFPSKVGGKPAWLSLKPVPNATDISCSSCGKPCIFLLQAYAPDDGTDTCFHRTIFVFMCNDSSCCQPNSNKNFVILRSQLPRANDFFNIEPPDEDTFDPNSDYAQAEKHGSLCVVCGCAGPKHCARCQKATYCSKEHQTIDWKGGHKLLCKTTPEKVIQHPGFLLREYELVTEPEDFNDKTEPEKSNEEKMKAFESVATPTKKGVLEDIANVEGDLEKMARTETQDDKVFNRFKKRISHEPEQVLRYDRGGVPLWVSSDGVPSEDDIPNCSCGSARSFEFQVMPQLLNHLHLDDVNSSIDWGTLAVFTCAANCNIGSNYHKEFIWKQDFTNTDAV